MVVLDASDLRTSFGGSTVCVANDKDDKYVSPYIRLTKRCRSEVMLVTCNSARELSARFADVSSGQKLACG